VNKSYNCQSIISA